MSYDGAQLPETLTADAGESSWFCFEGEGQGLSGPRRIAGLIWLHRTGPRVERVGPGLSLVSPRSLPAPLRGLVPSWLPLIAPLRVEQDERPLFMIVLYDLANPSAPPWWVEHAIDPAAFDAATFSAATADGALALHARPGPDGYVATVCARTETFDLDLTLRGPARMAVFGDDASPMLRHGAIEVGYAQRPRLAVNGRLRLGDAVIDGFVAAGAHDRHWRHSTVIDLQWIWLHLRLDDARALTAYVIRRSSGAAPEVGRACWLVHGHTDLTPLPGFDLRAEAEVDTPRGRVPVRFAVELPDLGARVVVHHVIEAPYVPMRAFGGLLDAGIHEGPIRVVESHGLTVEGGWVEVMNAAHARLGRPR